MHFSQYSYLISHDSTNRNCIKFTGIIADTAFDALGLIELMRLFLVTGDGFLRTFSCAGLTASAFFRIDFVMEKHFADA